MTNTHNQENLLHTVNQVAVALLTVNEQDVLKAITTGMEIVGRCLDVDRVQIWKCEVHDGEEYVVMKYQWLSEIGKQKKEVPIGTKYLRKERVNWFDMILQGKYINMPIPKTPEFSAEYGFLDLVSSAVLPLMLDKELIGIFSVDDCRHERVLSDDEMNMLKSAGLMIASVFNKIEQAVIDKELEMTERIHMMLETTPIAATLFSKDGKSLDCNQKAVTLFGTSSKEEYIDKFVLYMSPKHDGGFDSKDFINGYIKQALAEGYAFLPDFICRSAGGSLIILENTYIRTPYKNNFAVIEYARDITEVKKTEVRERQIREREREAAELTQKLLNNSPIFIEFWDTQGNMFDCNEKMLKVLGVPSKAEFAKRFYDFSAPIQPCGTPARELNNRMIDQAKEAGSSHCEWLYITTDGTELSTDSNWVHVKHQDRSMIIVYSLDLRPIKASLESEESNKAKSRFLARMSHEIRTPLSAVLGISEMQLRNKALTPQTEEAFAKIYDSSKTLLCIINDILDLSKVESGNVTLLHNDYNVAALVGDAAQLHSIYAESKGVLFVVDIDPGLPARLVGDALRIRQIIINILTNAFKYTEDGTVFFSLRWDDALLISICDTGIGMTEEQISESKGEYIRFHEQQKPYVTGTGLGIPIVYSLVDIMGGYIDLESKPGEGTDVHIRIPQKISGPEVIGAELAENLKNFKAISWSTAKELEFVPRQMPHGRVLVVDDVDTNLYVAEAMLEAFGLHIELCESGSQAIEKIKAGKVYDIIFLDYMMPEMDGIETTKMLRGMGYTHPIVALTANAIKGQAETLMANGFSGFISKPIDIKILNSYLIRFIPV
ncbi:MAG: response regulator [Defluviitaleaceae bacterium]|nr:response regulator [Defluviitaleaceae bacterium]MCL2203792.1 response regulator [Defluviitaleaceae bacterium]MCL2239261.1 response regulator [Defluviitaleaceae bacterium]